MSNSQCNRDGRPATSSALLESSRESWPIARRSKTSRACRARAAARRARAVAARRALDPCRVGGRRAAATATETTRRAGFWPSRRARARRADRAPRGREGDDRARGARGRRRRHEARRRRGVGAGCGRRGGQARAGDVPRAADGGHLRPGDGARSPRGGPGRRRTDDRSRGRGVGAHFSPATRPVGARARAARRGPLRPSRAGVRRGLGATRKWGRYSGDGGRAVRGAVSVPGAPVAGAAGRGLTSPFLFPSSL